ncbi:hypothetical protein DAI22_09g191700 [Oryza sativa Japonica Group]|nr:hypothetical protein DAI22_09g191700 [Oryza sativa Japonica Group]
MWPMSLLNMTGKLMEPILVQFIFAIFFDTKSRTVSCGSFQRKKLLWVSFSFPFKYQYWHFLSQMPFFCQC